MTYSEYEATYDDLCYALREGEINEDQFENEMEALQEQWEDEGEA